MSEIRKDPVTNRWVITLDDRNFKPGSGYGIEKDLPERDNACPFCPGNEDKTGKVIYSVKNPDDSWNIRVIPNNNPYLKVETQLKNKGVGIFDIMTGTGANEVIIESPRHDLDLDRLEIGHITSIIRTYKDRILDLKNDTRLEYMLIFKNRGSRAGENIHHLHSQLMALPVVPASITDEMDSSLKYFSFKKRCVYCDILENELMLKERLIKETEHFILAAPFASQTPFEMWVLPRRHSAHFHAITEQESRDLAYILKDAVTRLSRALNNPSYNYMIHSAPVKQGELDHYHWHIEILPRVKPIAGFEWGSGFFINPTLPEDSASYLRGITLP
jgi:UDPglucose--hexose-1-phosphate uridylyltransferase